MKVTDLLKALPIVAKAVAALVTPYVIVALAWVANHIVPFDVPAPGVVEAAIVSAISGIAVYFTRNRRVTRGF